MTILNTEQELAAAWMRVDERLSAMQRRHREKGDIPLYENALNPPATDKELRQLEKALGSSLPFELAYSLKHWNGRWIAHDHVIDLSCLSDHLAAVGYSPDINEVVGPINPVNDFTRRYAFGGHEGSKSFLYLDYEDPPAGGKVGQVIRIGQDPIAEYVAASFVEFLNLVADAPVRDDDPDFDPLKWRP